MIIGLVSQEKNLGILTLTDFLISKLGRVNTCVYGWNYLSSDTTAILEKIKESSKTKSVIIKYVCPKLKFSNQEIIYPKNLEDISDVIFRVPTYKEELLPQVPQQFYKGAENYMASRIKEFYA